ncbi:MAG: hypothetical protein WD601_04925 [Pseudohongiellaceae bacterium]
MKKYLISLSMVIAGCVAPEAGRITYTQDGSDMVATLSDGSTIRVPCVFTTTRTVSRIPQEVDSCEMAPEHRQYIQEREAEVSAAE